MNTDNANLPVSIGGALRCCLASLDEATPEQLASGEVKCRYCTTGRMVVAGDRWEARWD